MATLSVRQELTPMAMRRKRAGTANYETEAAEAKGRRKPRLGAGNRASGRRTGAYG